MEPLVIDGPLRDCVQACETICVAGCCGLDAFDLDVDHVGQWARQRTAQELAAARIALAACLSQVEAPTRWLTSELLGHHTGEHGQFRGALLAWLRRLDGALEAAENTKAASP